MQDKVTETRKTVIFTTTPRPSHTYTHKTLSYHIWKRSSTLIRLKCVHGVYLPPTIDTLSEQSACHNMSNIHTAWSLFCQILTGQCTTVLTNQKAKKIKHKKGINFYRCFDLQRHISCKTCCQNNATEGHKSVISVIKIRGIETFNINAHFCSGLMWDSVTMHRMKQNRKVWKK